jgi:hypothetical protein
MNYFYLWQHIPEFVKNAISVHYSIMLSTAKDTNKNSKA